MAWRRSAAKLWVTRSVTRSAWRPSGPTTPASSSAPLGQGVTLVHVTAHLEQLQVTFMSEAGLYGGHKSSR